MAGLIRVPDDFIDQLQHAFDLWLSELRRELTSDRTTPEQGAHAYPLTDPNHGITAITAPGGAQATTVANTLTGYAIRETTGSAGATVILRDGDGTDGREIIGITLAAGESTRDWFGAGISIIDGLYVDVTDGQIAGAVFLGTGGVR